MWPFAQMTVCQGKKRRLLNETTPKESIHDVSQSDTSLNENPTGNSFNNVTTVVKGPTDDDKSKSWKAWTMEMLTRDGDISTRMTNELEQMSEEYKKFLYAWATYSKIVIRYHMQQTIERQKVVNEYRSMTMEGMGLTTLELNLNKNDTMVISQIMQMIEVDNFWHQKTFEVVLTDLRRRWDEGIRKQKDMSMHCTENSEINNEMDGVEVIDLCSKNETRTSEFNDGKECTKQDSQDKKKSKTIARMESKNMAEKGKPMAESEENKTVMMCWKIKKTLWGKSLTKNQITRERNMSKHVKTKR